MTFLSDIGKIYAMDTEQDPQNMKLFLKTQRRFKAPDQARIKKRERVGISHSPRKKGRLLLDPADHGPIAFYFRFNFPETRCFHRFYLLIRRIDRHAGAMIRPNLSSDRVV